MKTLICLLCLGMILSTNSAQGHGFGLLLSTDINGNPVWIDSFSESTFPASGNDPAGPGNLFFDQFSGTANPDGSYRTDEGFAFTSGSWPTGSTYTFNVISPLWFADGSGSAIPAASGTYIHITDRYAGNSDGRHPGATNGATNVYGNTSFDPGFQVSLADPHELAKDIYFGPGANSYGEFGFAFNVTAHFANGQTLTSGPLVDIWATDIGTLGGFASNTTADQQTAATLAIYHTVMHGDFNLDGTTNAADVPVMLQALTDLDAYKAAHQMVQLELLAIGDFDSCGSVTNRDIQGLLDLIASQPGRGAGTAVPEPASLALMALGSLGVLAFRRRNCCFNKRLFSRRFWNPSTTAARRGRCGRVFCGTVTECQTAHGRTSDTV